MGARNHGATAPGLVAPASDIHGGMAPLGTAGAAAAVLSTAPDQLANPDKRFATLRARLALAGYTLSRTDNHDDRVTFYAGRWGLVAELRDLAAVEAFARRVGGEHA